MQSKCLTNGVTSPKENLKPVFNERCKVSEAKRSDVSYDSAFDVVRKTSYAKSVFNERCNIFDGKSFNVPYDFDVESVKPISLLAKSIIYMCLIQ